MQDLSKMLFKRYNKDNRAARIINTYVYVCNVHIRINISIFVY